VRRNFFVLVLVLLLFGHTRVGSTSSPDLPSAMEFVRVNLTELQRVFSDENLKKSERDRRVSEILHRVLDLSAMARSSLGVHYKDYRHREKEFVTAFSVFLERSFINLVELNPGVEIIYSHGRLDATYATIMTKVIVPNMKDPVSVAYRLSFNQGEWRVYGIIIEEIYIINNYRAQFARVIERDGFDGLLRKLSGHQNQTANATQQKGPP